MRHAARQLPAWLIFDVGQNAMMTSIRLLLPLLLTVLSAICADATKTANISELRPTEKERAALWESFQGAWSQFEAACLNGDAKALTSLCDERIVRWLSRAQLGTFLGDGWKADSLLIKRRLIFHAHEERLATAFVFVEVSEFGTSTLQAMVWVFRDFKWRCSNLPFEATVLGPTIKYPPFAVDEPVR